MESITLPVLGMTCAACQHHVEQALTKATGVQSARVDLMRHRAAVEFDPRITQPKDLIATIRSSGYDAVLPHTSGFGPASTTHDRQKNGWKATITIVCGAIVMVLSMPPGASSGTHTGPDSAMMHWLSWISQLPESSLRWALFLTTIVVAVWAGGQIYLSAWRALLHGETNMNTLVSLGTAVALLYSGYATLWPAPGQIAYFDSVLLILGFLLLGKWLEERARHRAIASVDALAQLQPAVVRLRRKAPGSDNLIEVLVPIEQVQPEDLAVILPGERIPADAIIVSGRTTVDESLLTGESTPQQRSVGDRVLAGSVNYDGAVTARIESAGAETTLAQIARLVEQAQSSRAPMERLADRASAIFVPVVLCLAVLTCLAWLLIAHDPAHAIASSVAVLVVACPCAMGLAVPAALTVAIGRGARFGILIKGGEALERLTNIQTVAFDKTGTLTLGKPHLIGINSLPGFVDTDLLRWAAAAEDHSSHPLAHAIVSHARETGLSWQPADDVQITPGRGLSARVEGHRCLLGNLEFMREWSIPSPDKTLPPPEPGTTRLWMAVSANNTDNFALAGYFDARDTVRPEAAAAIAWLHQKGMATTILTGDSSLAAGPVARAVGITDVAANLLPADKVSRIQEFQQRGFHVAMVGDGINDAAALAQADAGIAVGAGTALAQEAGDVLLLKNDPSGVCTAIALALAAIRVMRQNLIWASVYNIIGIPLAAGVLYPTFHLVLTPWMASAAMAFSSVSVLANSLRLRGWKAPQLSHPQRPAIAEAAL